MNKVLATLLIIVLISAAFPTVAFACTSFVEYTDSIIYGMNFDYPDTELRFVIHRTKAGKAFSMEFLQGNKFIPTVGINSEGLFVSTQMQYPEIPAKKTLDDNEIYIGQLGELIGEYKRVEQVRNYIGDKKLAPMPISVHQLYGDKYGDAMIVEVGDKKNNIVTISDKFMVMTNFKNSDFINKSYTEVKGVGDTRYKTASENILNNINDFRLESGWETLEKTVQEGSYPTLCSLIFDPQAGDIYFALNRDFEKVWRISLEQGTIEQFGGFTAHLKEKVPNDGLLASDLFKSDSAVSVFNQSDSGGNTGYIVCIIFVLFLLILYAVRFIVFKKGQDKRLVDKI